VPLASDPGSGTRREPRQESAPEPGALPPTTQEDIAPLSADAAHAALEQLAPVTFAYRADPRERHVGFVAEDVPALVATPDRKGLSPMDIVAVLTRVVQAQQRAVQDHRNVVQEQQRVMQEYQAALAELRAELAALRPATGR
jgi:hypothetical protein